MNRHWFVLSQEKSHNRTGTQRGNKRTKDGQRRGGRIVMRLWLSFLRIEHLQGKLSQCGMEWCGFVVLDCTPWDGWQNTTKTELLISGAHLEGTQSRWPSSAWYEMTCIHDEWGPPFEYAGVPTTPRVLENIVQPLKDLHLRQNQKPTVGPILWILIWDATIAQLSSGRHACLKEKAQQENGMCRPSTAFASDLPEEVGKKGIKQSYWLTSFHGWQDTKEN